MKPELSSAVAPVVIVGAGAAGLAVAYRLRQAGLTPVVLDGAARVAESWRQRHPALRLNTHRLLSSLPGLPIARSAGPFPSRDAIVRYLEDYERFVGVPVEFGVRVQRIEPEGAHWRLETSNGPRLAQHVIITTGRDRVPVVPDWPGRDEYPGELIHSANLGPAARYADRRVLVVGAGNSGTDVLNHLVRVDTRALWVSVRHGPVFMPTRLAGFPVQLSSVLMTPLPTRIVDRVLDATERLAFGDLRRWGLPRHADGAATRLERDGIAMAIDDGFVAALKRGRARIVPAIQRFEGGSVRLTGGEQVDPDVVICATGYRTGLESMLGHLGVLDDCGLPRLIGPMPQPSYPGLWFAGMQPKLSGYFHAARAESQELATSVMAELERRASGPLSDPHGLIPSQSLR